MTTILIIISCLIALAALALFLYLLPEDDGRPPMDWEHDRSQDGQAEKDKPDGFPKS